MYVLAAINRIDLIYIIVHSWYNLVRSKSTDPMSTKYSLAAASLTSLFLDLILILTH